MVDNFAHNENGRDEVILSQDEATVPLIVKTFRHKIVLLCRGSPLVSVALGIAVQGRRLFLRPSRSDSSSTDAASLVEYMAG